MQSFSRKTTCAYGKHEQEIGFIFSEPEETGRKNATLQQENVQLRTELSKQERRNNIKRGSKRKRTESKLEVPVDLRVGFRSYFIALMLEEKLFIVRDQSLCLFFRADRVDSVSSKAPTCLCCKTSQEPTNPHCLPLRAQF